MAKKKTAEKKKQNKDVSVIVSKADNFCKCWWNVILAENWQQKLGYSFCSNSFEMAPLGLRWLRWTDKKNAMLDVTNMLYNAWSAEGKTNQAFTRNVFTQAEQDKLNKSTITGKTAEDAEV